MKSCAILITDLAEAKSEVIRPVRADPPVASVSDRPR